MSVSSHANIKRVYYTRAYVTRSDLLVIVSALILRAQVRAG